MTSSRGSSKPRDWTQVSHTASTFFTVWTTREAQRVEPLGSHPTPGPLYLLLPLSGTLAQVFTWCVPSLSSSFCCHPPPQRSSGICMKNSSPTTCLTHQTFTFLCSVYHHQLSYTFVCFLSPATGMWVYMTIETFFLVLYSPTPTSINLLKMNPCLTYTRGSRTSEWIKAR